MAAWPGRRGLYRPPVRATLRACWVLGSRAVARKSARTSASPRTRTSRCCRPRAQPSDTTAFVFASGGIGRSVWRRRMRAAAAAGGAITAAGSPASPTRPVVRDMAKKAGREGSSMLAIVTATTPVRIPSGNAGLGGLASFHAAATAHRHSSSAARRATCRGSDAAHLVGVMAIRTRPGLIAERARI